MTTVKPTAILLNNINNDTYELINESINLPALTVDLVNKCLSIDDEWDASQEFRKLIS